MRVLHRRRSWAFGSIVTERRYEGKCCLVLNFRILFEPRDLWVGVYWNGTSLMNLSDIYIAPIPTLVLHFEFHWSSLAYDDVVRRSST